MKSPMVTMNRNNVTLEMYPEQLDEKVWVVVMREDGSSVHLSNENNYEACLEAMDAIMTSFAALGYDLNSEF